MPTMFDADYRVFVHNPPDEPSSGSPAVRYQHGPQRSGVMEWRTNDLESAKRKAIRIAQGYDKDNHMKPGGWVTVDKNLDGDWKAFALYNAETC